MGFVRVVSIEDDGPKIVCRLFSDNGGPVYAVPHNIYARTVLDHSIQTADGKTLWPDDGDAFLAQLCNRYCGSRFQVSEMETD